MGTGCSDAEVAERIRRGQVNDVPTTTTRSVGQIVARERPHPVQLPARQLLVVILIVGPYQDALFGFVLVANASVGIYQELRAKRTLDRLTLLTAPRARVIRAGHEAEIAVNEVVLDDVLALRAGDQIVVDGLVLSADGLELDESLLTGETDPLRKRPSDEVLSGSFVAAGAGRYRATRVGADAYATKLAEEAKRFTLVRSELRTGINRIIVLVTWALIPTAILLITSQLRANADVRSAVRGAVAGTVAMVPEGLVLLTSIAFAAGVVRLARKRVLVQELPAVEGLARVDVLCIDKTGTLTEGRLSVETVDWQGNDLDGARALAALAASDPAPNATMTSIGDAFPGTGSEPLPRPSAVVPFSSARKWSGGTFDGLGTWVLGAPDVLLDGDDPTISKARRRAAELAGTGRRVLVLAHPDSDLEGERLPTGARPVGLVVLRDRLRGDAAETLRYFAEQGVTVKVLSGDFPATVSAIASEAGLAGADDAVDARELPDDAQGLAAALDEHTVFGRVTPQQKREMVQALRSRGHVVAMTGDGVNDALALKEADMGVAMGSGSAATRATAQLVLLDSTLASLPPAVAEGRRVIGNIERTANLFVTKTVYAMLLSLAVGLAGLPFPFLPRHLTIISTLTIGIPGFFLALGPNTQRARPGFVPRVLRFSIPAGVIAAVATLAAYVLVRDQANVSTAQDRTSATMVLFWMGLLILATVARPLNPTRRLLIVAMASAFLFILAVPELRVFFDLVLPPLLVALAGFGIAALGASLVQLFVPGRGISGWGTPPEDQGQDGPRGSPAPGG